MILQAHSVVTVWYEVTVGLARTLDSEHNRVGRLHIDYIYVGYTMRLLTS